MNLDRPPRTLRLFILFILLVASLPLCAQIDKEFWFVGPEASENHGERPVYIRVSTMENPANINLRMPANNTFKPVVSAIPANSTISIRLDLIDGNNTWLDSIENKPADQVLNKGLLLTSDQNVTAYYEINNTSNPAIFPFKGKNGVGTEFFIPGQTDYANQTNDGSEAFDIVATEDMTLVTITPAIDIVGHLAGVPFQVTLDKGETYSARTLITAAGASLAGSHVVSDKPISITISDDSIITGGWDIIGDQIVPVNLLGWESIAIKGFASNVPTDNDERVYITGTQNGTDIFLDGNPVSIGTINAGEQYNYLIPNTTNTACIRTTKPAYIYHLTGHPGEAGASILPQDSCTGSRMVGFNRSTASAFALLILTRSGNEGSFQLNGNNSIITAPDFSVVPGTGGDWMYYRHNNFTTAQVPVGANILENSNGKFHLGILNNVGASSEYGYFSDFSTLYLGSDASICPGDSMVLDGGPYRTSYDWKRLIAGVWTTVGTNQVYTVKDTGYYSCVTDGDFCLLMDTIQISYYPNGTVSLGTDRTICEGTTTTFTPGNYVTYEWSTGATTPTLTTGEPGAVWIEVTNNNGCIARDTVMIFLDSLPLSNHLVTGASPVCQGQNNVGYSIEPLSYAMSYAWTFPSGVSGASSTNTISLDFSASAVSGPVTVHGVNLCGTGPDVSLAVTVDPLPSAAGTITGPPEVCQGQAGILFTVDAIAHASTYLWTLPPGCAITSGSGTSAIMVNAALNASSGLLTVSGNNSCGDGPTSSLPLSVNLFPEPAGAITGPEPVCQGQQDVAFSIPPIPGADSYQWSLPTGALITAGAGTNSVVITFDSTALSGILTVHGHSDQCGNGIPKSMALTVNPLPAPPGAITGPLTVCQGQTGVLFSISPVNYATSYLWTVPPGCTIISGAGTHSIVTSFNTAAINGLITVRGQNPTCGNGRHAFLTLVVNPLPQPPGVILGPASVCQGETNIPYAVGVPDPLTLSWTWTLSPAGSGLVSGSTPGITINWNDAFTGSASLAVTGMNGCGAGQVSPVFPILIKLKPEVLYRDCGDLSTTKNAQPVILKGGYPLGPTGVYSGTGVSEISPGIFVFNPGVSSVIPSAGGTPYTITYRYTAVNDCFREAAKVIKVYPSNAANPCPGTVTDVRDGRTYRTFITGSGPSARCWMAENLNYGDFSNSILPQTDNCVVEKYCVDDIPANCGHSGGYYQWDEVMNYGTVEGAQGLCPPGWRVPSEAEWDLLINDNQGVGLAGTFLRNTENSAGFNGLTTGILYLNNSWNYTGIPVSGSMFWTSHLVNSGNARANGLNDISLSVSRWHSSRAHAFSVRCVR